jgi:hypothetical protein
MNTSPKTKRHKVFDEKNHIKTRLAAAAAAAPRGSGAGLKLLRF